ncbi:ATP-binding cassette sub-family G member 3, partial [Sigmodon hispidus]
MCLWDNFDGSEFFIYSVPWSDLSFMPLPSKCWKSRMSMRGRTIIFSINQPQYFIFRFFDSLTLVSSGKVMFHGPAQEALEYFTSA